MNELRCTLRIHAKNPVFCLAIILVLGAGIGPDTRITRATEISRMLSGPGALREASETPASDTDNPAKAVRQLQPTDLLLMNHGAGLTSGVALEIPLPDLPALAKPLAFVLIPRGTFLMGSPAGEAERREDEGPQTRVTFTRPFLMSRYEVTKAQWAALMTNNPSFFQGGTNCPVEDVQRGQTMEFCVKLTDKARQKFERWPEGYVFRLPTEAEWEYACRAGTTTPFHWGESLDSSQANFDGTAPYQAQAGVWREQTVPVGSFRPNAWGLYDMHGNVYEFCLDTFSDSLPGGGGVTDPKAAANCYGRLVRGGGWSSRARECRSAFRAFDPPGNWQGSFGFRPVLAPLL